MKTTLSILLAVCAFTTFAADNVKETPNKLPTTWLATATLEPYVTMGWEGVDGSGRGGAGANLVFDLSRGLSLWSFAETDNTEHSVFDRSGAGLRYTAKLSQHVSLDAGVAGAYDFEREHVFARIPLGVSLNLLHTGYLDAGLRVAYAFDITGGNAKHSNADGRVFAGPVATLKW